MTSNNSSPIAGLREVNNDPLLGSKFIVPADHAPAREFLKWLGELIPAGSFDRFHSREIVAEVAGSPVAWRREKFTLYPLYIERLTVASSAGVGNSEPAVPMRQVAPGDWLLDESVLREDSGSYFRGNEGQWREFILKMCDAGCSGGFAANNLTIPQAALSSGEIDIRPLVLHALSRQGVAVDRGDRAAQAAIANAFWQTFWATGARRAERGNTFPVAFLPIDRSWPGEFEPPFREWYVSLRRRLFGRTSILACICEALTKSRALYFDPLEGRFAVNGKPDSSEAPIPDDKLALALFELNRTAFVDAFTGENERLFCDVADLDAYHQPGAPWSSEIPDPGTYVALSETLKKCVRIHRVVPYSGCAFLYQAVSEIDSLRASEKARDFDDEILAGTNSTFFLNFPEEYATLHSAMNDPVSLLVENGRTHQIKTLRRAAFVLTEDGQPLITTAAGNKLNCEALVYEGESSSITSFDRAKRSFAENSYGPLFFGSVLVGDSIVETFEEISTEIPSNGWIVGDSEAFGGRLDPRHAAEVQVRALDGHSNLPIRHAFAVGPLLVQDGKPAPLGASREEFQPIVLNEVPSFEDSRELSRTQLPPAFMTCAKRGVVPTRFPYDEDLTRAPRTAIGIRANGDVVLAVVDGRADLVHSIGVTLRELAQVMINLGCLSAMNMDGGGSSVMFVQDGQAVGKKLRSHLRDGVVNLPSDLGGVERLLPVPLLITRKRKGKD